MIDRLVAALRSSGSDPEWRELADVLWLATATAVGAQSETYVDERSPTGTATDPPLATAAGATAPSPPAPAEVPDAGNAGQARVVASDGPRDKAAVGAEDRVVDLTVAAPALFALPRRLEIGRALRPFKHRQGAGQRRVLDAEATVDRFCDTNVLVPVLKPAAERWFDIAVVTDASSTMAVWQDTVAAFADLLERHGAFRRVTRWSLVDRRDGPRVVGSSGAAYHPRELTDTSGRRVVLVVTDCIDRLWRGDAAWAAMRDWGRVGPVALVQTLPARLWHLTAMGDADVEVSAQRPGLPNRQLAVTEPWWWSPGTQLDNPIPVLTLDDERMGPWARMVTGGGAVTLAAVAGVPPPSQSYPTGAPNPGELVETFRVTVSLAAYRLATLLSAVEVSLPIARILQERLLPDPRLEDLAEVLAGGVLQSSGGPEPALDFRPGVRDLLQASLTTTDVIDVWRTIGPFLEATDQHAEFYLVLESAASVGDGTAAVASTDVGTDGGERRTQASIAAALIKRLGLAAPERLVAGEAIPVPVEPLDAPAEAARPRLVIELSRHGADTMARMAEPGGAPEWSPFDAADPAVGQPEDSLGAGRQLFAALTRHPAIGPQLRSVLRTSPGGRCPIWVRQSQSGELGAWEALRDEHGMFLALDDRWPVGRIPRRHRETPVGVLHLPLRIVAVLSANGISGITELDALLTALRSPVAAIGVSLHIITGDEAVVHEARTAGNGVTAELIGAGAAEWSRQILAARPHLLHLFGHSGAVVGLNTIAFASQGDLLAGSDRGSIRIDAQTLASAMPTGGPRLVVLVGSDTAGLADELTSIGVTAAIGMNGSSSVVEISRFTAALYMELINMFVGVVTGADEAGRPRMQQVDWSAAMSAPRRKLAGSDPGGNDAWTRPVLFAPPTPFELFVPAEPVTEDDARLVAEIDAMRRLFAALDPATAPSAVLDELRTRIAEVETELGRRGAMPDADTRDGPAVDVSINVWTGHETAHGPIVTLPGVIGQLDPAGAARPMGHRTPADRSLWNNPDVGYGVLVPESDASPIDKAHGVDLPPPVQILLNERPGTLVLRWGPSLPDGVVRRYADDGGITDVQIGLSPFGIRRGALPRYVTIIASPAEIPWSVQYRLAAAHAVGRLPLAGKALGYYIGAMLDGWPDRDIDVLAPLLWSADLPRHITARMRTNLVDPLAARLAGDGLSGSGLRQLTGSHATRAGLIEGLTTARPALVVTSSLGAAEGPPRRLRSTLGLPVDPQGQTVDLDALDAAMPGGAVWCAAAAWSAGSDGQNKHSDLFLAGTSAAASLAAVAALGPTASPAARRLLGRVRPVRAVIGHVEPAFDIVVDTPIQREASSALVDALSARLFGGDPVGLALGNYWAGLAGLYGQLAYAKEQLSKGDSGAYDRLVLLRLAVHGLQSLVLLGDPTVTLPSIDLAS